VVFAAPRPEPPCVSGSAGLTPEAGCGDSPDAERERGRLIVRRGFMPQNLGIPLRQHITPKECKKWAPERGLRAPPQPAPDPFMQKLLPSRVLPI